QETDRQWTDSTGRFTIQGRLLEVKDGFAFIRNTAGKSIKIPVARLSKKDQEFVKGGRNPFEEVKESAAAGDDAGINQRGSAIWGSPQEVQWDRADQVTSAAGVAWKVPPGPGALEFEAKRAALSGKTTFHEHMHPLVINPLCRRAVVGYTVSFAVPKPLTRISLVDLVTGKSVHSEQVEANMRPLALLDNGGAILMVGAGDGRGGYETKDQLQIWRFRGKKIIRSPSWVPYPMDKKDFGKQRNALVVNAKQIRDHLVLTLSDKGHLVLWDILARRPIWHLRLNSRNFAMDVSVDRKQLAVVDNKTLMVMETESAQILGSTALPADTHVGWPRVAWAPSGKRLLFTSMGDIRVLDVQSGQWVQEISFPGGPIAPNGLAYPDEEYALLNNRLLVHLPTKIKVCDYQNAGSIRCCGGVSFIAINGGERGLLVPAKFPHPAAEKMLQKAKDDPSLFLIHPGVAVAIDVTGVGGQHRAQAEQGLRKAAEASGYKVDRSSPIKIIGAISGPKQEAVSYILNENC
ncbi:MAG: hypothetical protein MI861_15620, partial [Pirellulales bacterium]|nr:hypothetical protein [Pirellulales bacterium]